MKTFVGCVAICALAGCASAESSGDTPAIDKRLSARLHIEHIGRADHVKVLMLRGPIKGCHVGDAIELASFGSLRERQDVTISAERPVTLNISSVAEVRCEFRARFSPEPGAQYRLTYRTVPGGCLLSLERRQDRGWIAEPYADPNPECLPKPDGARQR